MNVTPAYYLCGTGIETVESNVTTYTGCQIKTNEIIIRYIHIRYTRFLAEF